MGQAEYLGKQSRRGGGRGTYPCSTLSVMELTHLKLPGPGPLELLHASELSLTMPSSDSRGQQRACLPQRVMGTWSSTFSYGYMQVAPLIQSLGSPRHSGPGGLTLPVSYRGYSSTSVPHYITPPPPTSRAVDHTLWPWCGQSGCFEEGPGHFSLCHKLCSAGLSLSHLLPLDSLDPQPGPLSTSNLLSELCCLSYWKEYN